MLVYVTNEGKGRGFTQKRNLIFGVLLAALLFNFLSRCAWLFHCFFVFPEEVAGANNGKDFTWATDADERNRLWKARHEILYACTALVPGSKVSGLAMKSCMPVQRSSQGPRSMGWLLPS